MFPNNVRNESFGFQARRSGNSEAYSKESVEEFPQSRSRNPRIAVERLLGNMSIR